jgi:predicted peptidase
MKGIMIGFVLLATAFINHTAAQDTSIYLKKVFTHGNESMPYRILLPRDYDSSKKYPVVLFLHGETERGNDNEKQLTKGSAIFLQGNIRRRYPAIVVFPQCPKNSYWSNVTTTKERKTKKLILTFHSNEEPTKAMQMVMGLQQELIQQLSVDSSKLYVMGISNGGTGTYEMLLRMPGVFAAAVPMAGAGDTLSAKDIRKTAFWVFHGANDDVVPLQYSQDMVGALQKFYSTTDMQYTVYSNTAHNCWDQALADPELLRWLFAQRLQR